MPCLGVRFPAGLFPVVHDFLAGKRESVPLFLQNDLVELNRVDDNIVITKVKKEKELTLEDIFKDYDGEYKAEEFDWGSPIGKEVW